MLTPGLGKHGLPMKPPTQSVKAAHYHAGRILGLCLLAASIGGCRTGGVASTSNPGDLQDEAFGQVVRVNAEQGFVILDCLAPPRPGEELAVWRGETKVAWVRATERRRPPFVAADVIAGEPRRGDVARAERFTPEAASETRP